MNDLKKQISRDFSARSHTYVEKYHLPKQANRRMHRSHIEASGTLGAPATAKGQSPPTPPR